EGSGRKGQNGEVTSHQSAFLKVGRGPRTIQDSQVAAGTIDLGLLEEILGYQFKDRELLARSLTHKSRGHETPGDGPLGGNEQFEFLGDAILGFVVSETLVRRHSAFPEGRLSKLKAHLVSANHLYESAQGIRLGDFLYLGRGEELSGGRRKKALLSDALEALI